MNIFLSLPRFIQPQQLHEIPHFPLAVLIALTFAASNAAAQRFWS